MNSDKNAFSIAMLLKENNIEHKEILRKVEVLNVNTAVLQVKLDNVLSQLSAYCSSAEETKSRLVPLEAYMNSTKAKIRVLLAGVSSVGAVTLFVITVMKAIGVL